MRDVLRILAIAAAAFATVSAVTFAGGDRQTLVPPPDAVAESFARQMAEERYQLALKFLSRELRQKTRPESLRAQYGVLHSALGRPTAVRAELDWIGAEEAAARAMVESDRGSAVLSLRFARERGLWTVRDLPQPAIAMRWCGRCTATPLSFCRSEWHS